MRWRKQKNRWIPTAMEGGRHICTLKDPFRKETRPRLEPHQKLNRQEIHLKDEDMILKILEDKPLS